MKRSSNGQGTIPALSVEFDLTNTAQARAWKVAQRKAKNYGVRKALFMAFLNAIEDYELATGRELTTDMVSGFVIARAMSGGGLFSAENGTPPTPIPKDEIIVVSSEKKTAHETAVAFMSDMGNMFG